MTDINEQYLPICTECYGVRVEPHRAKVLRPTCMECAEKVAKRVKRTIAPMHKSNYMLITNMEDLKGINNKGGLFK